MTTPTTAAGNADGNAERARLITPEDQPVFPCWLWRSPDEQWHRIISPAASCFSLWGNLGPHNGFTHWHPDQPTAPTCTPQAALSPGNAMPAGETKAPQGLREALERAHKAMQFTYDVLAAYENQPSLLGIRTNSILPELRSAFAVVRPALAPYVTAQPAPSPAREDGATPETNALFDCIAANFAKYHNGEIYAEDMGACLVQARNEVSRLERDLTTARQQLAEARAEGERLKTLWTEMRVVLAQSRDANCLASYGAAQVDAVEAANKILNTMPADMGNALATLRTLASELAGAAQEIRPKWDAQDSTAKTELAVEDAITRLDAALARFRSSTPAPAPAPAAKSNSPSAGDVGGNKP